MSGSIEVDPRFHESKALTITKVGQKHKIDCGFEGRGYRWEAAHVQEIIGQGLKESPVMTLEFSKQLIQLLDEVRGKLNIEYPAI